MSPKAYLRYRQSGVLGIIASSNGNSIYDNTGKYVLTPALESVGVWDWKKGVEIAKWTDSDVSSEVTCICKSAAGSLVAVGYADGSIRLWDTRTHSTNITFNGHKSAVTAMCFDKEGARLASGSKDTDLIVWDVSAECGLYRLKGHRDQITGLCFLRDDELKNYLASTSKDTLLKVWDLETQHCVETVIAHRSEVWGLCASVDGQYLFTAAVDQEIRAWKIDKIMLMKKLETVSAGGLNENSSENKEDIVEQSALSLYGIIERQSKERAVNLLAHPSGRYIGVQASDKSVEVFKIRNQEELKKRLQRKKKRLREKKKDDMDVDNMDEEAITLADEIVAHCIIRCTAKIRSFDFAPPVPSRGKAKSNVDDLSIVCALANNSIEVYTCGDMEEDQDESIRLVCTLDLQGHRSDVRALALSSNDELLVSGSNTSIKIWNIHNKQCIKTMESGYVLCATFVPGNKHVIVGTKTGEIDIYDLSSSSLVESIKAHDGPVWSIQVRPDKTGLTSGSADKQVKFWDFQLVANDKNASKKLSLAHTRTLKMSDDVLCVCHSPDSRLLAVSLLDSTVKVFFFDTLKFSLSLYGHKLPVLSMDISSDSAIIATASADKSIKIWGLDFGDCHRSILAHQDSVMSCKFVWGTHYLFSVGKDRCVKYWDGDKFENIMKLQGHLGEVWALAVAKYGVFIVTGSHDRSIRIWEKTDEQLFLEEEREKELEELYEKTNLNEDERYDRPVGSGADDQAGDLILDPTKRAEDAVDEVGAAGKKTSTTLKAGEKVMEALEIWEHERRALDAYQQALAQGTRQVAPPAKSPFILALGNPDMTPEGYVLYVLEKIRSSDLEQALLVLPFVKVEALLKCISVWTEKGINVQLTNRVLTFILRLHHNQLSSSSSKLLHPILESIQNTNKYQLGLWKDKVGFNLAASKMLLRTWQSRHASDFIENQEPIDQGTIKKRKRFVVKS